MDRLATRKNKDRLDRTIGQNIRTERELRKMSREELAEILDLTVSHMGLIERGERGATAVTLEKLSRVFEVTIDDLFAEPERKRLVLNEERDGNVASNRRKIASLLTRLDEKETDFLIHIIKGIIGNHLIRNAE